MIATINFSLQIFVLGLLTVFFVLIMVVLFGNLIIITTNRYFGVAAKEVKPPSEQIDPVKIAVISGAVYNVTRGRGRVKRIEKL